MDTAYLTPWATDDTDAVELGHKLWRKPILKRETIDYKGRKITFDDPYFKQLQLAFNGGAMDQVPAQLADGDNKHTFDPKRYGGELKGLEITPRGLEGIFELTEDANKLVEQNKKLGVSARILEAGKAEGRKYNKMLQHVLLTLDPRRTGLGPWEEVTLSNDAGDVEVIDLSAGGEEMAKEETKAEETENKTETKTEAKAENQGEEYTPTPEEEELAAQVVNELMGEETSESEANPELVAANLANEGRISALEVELAHSRWENESAKLIDAGVPPAMVEKAGKLLSQPGGAVLEFAHGDSVDAAQVIRDLLDQSKGFVELARERGHSYEDEQDEDARDQQILKNWHIK